MKRSKTPTPHILIKASTTSKWDEVTFAIIHLSADWKARMAERMVAVSQFKRSREFYCQVYRDAPLGYYTGTLPGSLLDKILRRHEDYIYITLEADEESTLPRPVNKLDVHQLFITKNGIAHYRTYGKHTGEEFRTEEFNLMKLIAGKPT
ncbi:hypothetical protein [Pedobacter frigoris]|uniref:Uncharacterized protein n=1 Tax=Pedobacter frigoris TaxID=2571272 RepID=A0A4U1CQI8_9SPHI|nr:hypothetical protein [Pedobacter frigoris]TKC09160.1 hypothetical protein FA047_03430 [Pedobacter frigoris]